MGRRWVENWPRARQVPNRMVITLAIVGPMDVQEEWSKKYQLFCDRWALPRHFFFYPFPGYAILHSFMMFLLLLLDSYASYADDYQPSISDFFHLLWIYRICVTVTDLTFLSDVDLFLFPCRIFSVWLVHIQYWISYHYTNIWDSFWPLRCSALSICRVPSIKDEGAVRFQRIAPTR